MINQIMPLLNKFIPPALAMKGLSKVDPKMKDFFNSAIGYGYGTDAVLDFLRQHFSSGPSAEETRLLGKEKGGALRPDEAANLAQLKSQQQTMASIPKIAGAAGMAAGAAGMPMMDIIGTVANMLPGKAEKKEESEKEEKEEGGNPIERMSTELHGMLLEHIKKGHPPEDAAAIVRSLSDSKQLQHIKVMIDKLEKKHKMSFESIVKKHYGQEQAPLSAPQAQASQGGDDELLKSLMEIRNALGNQ